MWLSKLSARGESVRRGASSLHIERGTFRGRGFWEKQSRSRCCGEVLRAWLLAAALAPAGTALAQPSVLQQGARSRARPGEACFPQTSCAELFGAWPLPWETGQRCECSLWSLLPEASVLVSVTGQFRRLEETPAKLPAACPVQRRGSWVTARRADSPCADFSACIATPHPSSRRSPVLHAGEGRLGGAE